jgi:hypothetical protein
MPISLPHLRTSVDLDINYYNYLDREYNNMIINSKQQTLLFYYFTQIYLSILLPNKKEFLHFIRLKESVLRFYDPGYLSPLAPQGHEIHPNPELLR